MEKLEPVTPHESPEVELSDVRVMPARDANFVSLKGFFGLDNPSTDEIDALNFIYDFFESRADSMGDMLIQIRQIEGRVGVAPLGVNRAAHLKNYLKTLKGIEDLNKQRIAYEQGI